MNDSFTKIKTSHKFTGDAEGLRNYYAGWAQNYNRDLVDQGWIAPEVTCDIVRAIASSYSPPEANVLDAGCGTGLVGLGLLRRGFKIIDGIDLTEQMVELASKTGAYRNLRSGIDFNIQAHAGPVTKYDIVVSCGMFTLGHADPIALLSLLRYALPSGLVVVSTRASYALATGFEAFLRDKILGPETELMLCVRDARYIKEESGHYWILRRLV